MCVLLLLTQGAPPGGTAGPELGCGFVGRTSMVLELPPESAPAGGTWRPPFHPESHVSLLLASVWPCDLSCTGGLEASLPRRQTSGARGKEESRREAGRGLCSRLQGD